MLRLQNKYRNILKKEPEKIRETERELGLPVSREAKNKACAQGKKAGTKTYGNHRRKAELLRAQTAVREEQRPKRFAANF